jgi:hypothetical protein
MPTGFQLAVQVQLRSTARSFWGLRGLKWEEPQRTIYESVASAKRSGEPFIRRNPDFPAGFPWNNLLINAVSR